MSFRDQFGKQHQEAISDLRDPGKRWKPEALVRLYERMKEVDASRSAQANERPLTVAALVDSYLENHVVSVQPETRTEYGATADLYIVPHLGERMAKDVKRADVEALRAKLLATPVRKQRTPKKGEPPGEPRLLSPRTVARALELVGAVYKYALGHEWVLSDPTVGVRKPGKSSGLAIAQTNTLTQHQLRKLFEHATPRWELLLKFTAYTGLRAAEICGLRWSDVHFASCTAWVCQTYRRGRFKPPKSKRARRVEFPATLVKELKIWRLACPKGEHDLVFPSATGKPQDAANLLHRGLRPALRRAGLPPIRFHDLRHTYATLQLADGEGLGAVSRQLGHNSSTVTLSVYRHVLPGEGKGLGDRMAARVAAATASDDADETACDGNKVVAIEAEEAPRGA